MRIERIKQAINLFEAIQRWYPSIELRKIGYQWGCSCPFHNEKTPSFFVSQDGSFFRCFGCDEKGDLFSFVMRYERLPFYEALQEIERRLGFEGSLSEAKWLASEWEKLRRKQEAEVAKASLETKAEEIEWPPNEPLFGSEETPELRYLLKRGVTLQQIESYDFRRGILGSWKSRVLLPIKEQGRLVGLQGRTILASEKIRYLTKGIAGRIIWGFDEALSFTRERAAWIKTKDCPLAEKQPWMGGTLVLVEGVFSALKVGPPACALLGNKITDTQRSKLVRAGVRSVIVCLDSDAWLPSKERTPREQGNLSRVAQTTRERTLNTEEGQCPVFRLCLRLLRVGISVRLAILLQGDPDEAGEATVWQAIRSSVALSNEKDALDFFAQLYR